MNIQTFGDEIQMSTNGFEDSFGPPSLLEPARPARGEGRLAAARLLRALAPHAPEAEARRERLAVWCRRLAFDLGLPPERLLDIELGAVLHDVGSLALAALDVDKGRQRSAGDQRREGEIGAALLDGHPALRRAMPLVRSRHAEYDGGGVPHGLKGCAIPIDGRIFRLVDAYETLTHSRPEMRWLIDQDARVKMARAVGRSFDPLVHAAFARIEPAEWRALVKDL